jgi:hypothetical protein
LGRGQQGIAWAAGGRGGREWEWGMSGRVIVVGNTVINTTAITHTTTTYITYITHITITIIYIIGTSFITHFINGAMSGGLINLHPLSVFSVTIDITLII